MATKSATAATANKTTTTTAKKTPLDINVDRIQKTAKNVNKEVAKTANVVVGNMKADGKELKALATKTVKEASKKIDVKKNVAIIRKTTASVNQQIRKTTEEVMEDVKTIGMKRAKITAKYAKEAIQNFDLDKQVDAAKKTAKKVNVLVLETADEMVDGVFTNGEKWQKVAEKAVKGGLHLAGRQQEIMFDTLETVKGQLAKSTVRFKKLFSSN